MPERPITNQTIREELILWFAQACERRMRSEAEGTAEQAGSREGAGGPMPAERKGAR